MLRKSFPPNLCRLCGLDKTQGIDVCSPTAKRAGLLTKINKKLSKEGVHIAVGDGLPKFVCSDCEVTINDFTEFCKMVQQVQKRLEDEKLGFEEISHKAAPTPEPSQNKFKTQQKVTTIGSVTESSVTVSVGPDGKVECKICQKYMEAVEHTTLHMVTHGIGTVISSCRNCGHQGELSQFLRCSSGREDKNTVWCENCGFQPKTKVKGSDDSKNKHIDQRKHNCEICLKEFNSRAHLKRHQIVHSGAKPFLCEVCGSGFSQKSSLKMHVLSHAGLNPHKCEQCGQSFRFKASLRSHMMSLHWPSGGSNATINDCIYRCDHCGKQFATAYKLRRHFRMHTGERPYECNICGRLFSQTCNLNLHRKKHESQDVPEGKDPPSNYDSVVNKNRLSDTIVRKPSEQYSSSILGHQQNSVQQESASFVRETSEILDNTHDPKFLERILQHPVVPCSSLDVSETPLTSIDTVLIQSNAKNSDHPSPFVPLPSEFGATSTHLTPEYLNISAETDNKNLQEKSEPGLFPDFPDDELLYMDQSSNLQPPSAPDNVSLPTFSSLQTGPSVSISDISH